MNLIFILNNTSRVSNRIKFQKSEKHEIRFEFVFLILLVIVHEIISICVKKKIIIIIEQVLMYKHV